MKVQLYRVGDRVEIRSKSLIGIINAAKYRKEGNNVLAFVHGTTIAINWEPSWMYRVNFDYSVKQKGYINSIFWYPSDSLVSMIPCPGCQEIGWNWNIMYVCDRCGLSPSDRK